ncbi:hypothetical protein SLA2020_438830 [Shorea laevis]
MAAVDVPLDDKAKRMRDLLSSFYSPDPSMSSSPDTTSSSSKRTTLDAINSNSFDPDQYMNLLVEKSNLEGLLQRHVEMAAEIKNLDTDLQMLVYENYNKFISATDTIKRMKSNIVGMESNMEQLLEKIMSVQSRSDGVNSSLFEKREHVEKLHRTVISFVKFSLEFSMYELHIFHLCDKEQFIYDLPARLGKCIKSEAYADAVRFYTGATPIFKAYGDSSFQDCKRASEEAMATIIKNLEGKLFSDSESIQARAEAAVLLKQLDFPVESLKARLLEKLAQSLAELQLHTEELSNASVDSSKEGSIPGSAPTAAHEASVREFVEPVRAYRVIFPDSENQLVKLAQDVVTKHFEMTEEYVKKQICSAELLHVLRIIWTDVLLMDEVLHEAALPDYSLEAAKVALKQYVASTFSHLLHNISGSLTKIALEASKKAVLQGSMDVLLDFRQILEDNLELLVQLKDLIIDLVQEGFQDFFRALDDHFILLSGRKNSASLGQGFAEGTQVDKAFAGLVLVLAQLSVFIEQTAIPRITEEIAASFSGGGARGYEYGPPFVPGEICRIFRSAGEKFLHLYINMRTQRISLLLKKRFTTPNWVKHKEPREVHMFIDLFLQELEAIEFEVKQILPQGLRRHRRNDSNGTKVEIFTKVEYTQESVVTTVVKLCLKSFQEFVRLQTFNRSGFQQIQLDIQFLRTPLKETVEDEAAIDFLLDEVIVATSERCLDPNPLEPPILDKLIQAKLAKNRDQSPITP